MAEIVLERWTRCPTGKPKDEIFFEIVLEDDSPLGANNRTPRTTRIKRLFVRGDASVLKGRLRDGLMTTGRDSSRMIVTAFRSDEQISVDLSALNLTITWPPERGRLPTWDYYGGPAKGEIKPVSGTPFDDYRAREVKPAR